MAITEQLYWFQTARFSVTTLIMVHVMNAFDTSYASAAMRSAMYTIGLLDVWWTIYLRGLEQRKCIAIFVVILMH